MFVGGQNALSLIWVACGLFVAAFLGKLFICGILDDCDVFSKQKQPLSLVVHLSIFHRNLRQEVLIFEC